MRNEKIEMRKVFVLHQIFNKHVKTANMVLAFLYTLFSLLFFCTCENIFDPPSKPVDNNVSGDVCLVRIYIGEYDASARTVQPSHDAVKGYRLTFSGPRTRAAVDITEGNSADVSLHDGTWVITATAYTLSGAIGNNNDAVASGSITVSLANGAVTGTIAPIILAPSGTGTGTIQYSITAGSGVSGSMKLFAIDGNTPVSSFAVDGELAISDTVSADFALAAGRYICEVKLVNEEGHVAFHNEVIEIWKGTTTTFTFDPEVFFDPNIILPDLNYGDFNVTSIDLQNISFTNNTLTITGNGTYTIDMRLGVTATTADRIAVSSGVNADITLNGVNINVSSTSGVCAFDMTGATVNLTLVGDTILRSGSARAGLQASAGSTLVITAASTGSLTATGGNYGAGIGGGQNGAGGTININGGSITATAGTSGAGIGGGSSGSGGTITAITGNAVIFASSIQPALPSGSNLGPAIVFIGNNGTMYGNVTLQQNVTFPPEYVLSVQSGQSLTIPDGITLTNNGTIICYGVINEIGTIIGNQPVMNVDMVWIPAGTFTMGSPTTEPDRNSGETQRQVTLTKGFYMGKYEVTQEQYQAVTGVNPSNFSSNPAAGETQGRRPVERVSWYDAIVFCNKLSVMEGLTPAYRINGSTDPDIWIATHGPIPTIWDDPLKAIWDAVEVVSGSTGYRLPTEAQWEYACRAGTTTAYNTGDTITDNTGWYSSNSGSRTHEVGKKPPNAWGLYDMHGNVWEWCWDWYGTYASGVQTDPTGRSSGSFRVLRGGGWIDYAQVVRSAYRFDISPHGSNGYIGFRLLRP